MLTIASWNMNRTTGSWSYLRELRDRHGVDVFLLQEAGRPPSAPSGFVIEPDPNETERWKNLPQRWYCSAIATAEGVPRLTPRRPIPHRDAKAEWGEFVASHPGQFAVGDIESSDGDVVTVVSLYGIWDKIPETGELFGEATLHRAISDLAVVFQGRDADNILVAGDLNVWHAYKGDGNLWVKRYATVFDRLASFGLELLGPFRPDGMPLLEGCPCNTAAPIIVGIATTGCTGVNRPHPSYLASWLRGAQARYEPGFSSPGAFAAVEVPAGPAPRRGAVGPWRSPTGSAARPPPTRRVARRSPR